MGRQISKGDKITWIEGACSLSFAMAEAVAGKHDGATALGDGSSPLVFLFCSVSTLPSLFLFYFLFFRFVHSFSLLCFCFFSLLFSHPRFSFLCPLFSSLLFCIYRQIHGERGLLPLTSHGTKRVVSFKRKWSQKREVQISPQFVICSIKS